LFVVVIEDPNATRRIVKAGLRAGRDLADRTGGVVLVVRDPKELEDVFQQVQAQIESQLLITFKPPLRAKSGKFQKISVTAAEKGWKVRHPEGLFTPAAN